MIKTLHKHQTPRVNTHNNNTYICDIYIRGYVNWTNGQSISHTDKQHMITTIITTDSTHSLTYHGKHFIARKTS